MEDIIIGAHISDIHFGAGDDDQLYAQLSKDFIGVLEKLPVLDIIVNAGDTYDYNLPLESRGSKLSMRFINKDLIRIAKTKNASIRMIEGTFSHDANQLENFSFLEERDDIDFKIIKTATSENFRGFNILYIPEEYMKDRDKFYQPFLKEQYDLAFGHGMFQSMSFKSNDSEIQVKNAPVFPDNYFMKHVYGPVLFGHIHTMTKINSQVYYSGSFNRWIMGEEKKKGFYIFVYNKKTHKYLVLPYFNSAAPKYITMDLNPYLKYPVETILKTIDNCITAENIKKLRLTISYTGDNKNKLANIAILKDYYDGKKNVVIDIKNGKLKKIEKKKKKIVSKYNYLFDNTDIETKVSQFIKEDLNYNISVDKVDAILNGNILDDLED